MRPLTCVPNPACTNVTTIKPAMARDAPGAPVCTRLHPPAPACTRCTRCIRRIQQQLHDHDRDDQVRGDDPCREFVRDDAAAEPAFETHQQERGDRRPQDSRMMAMMAPRRDRGGENQEADGDAEQTVQVLRPHQRRIELRDRTAAEDPPPMPAGSIQPKQRGQSGQPRPAPDARTSPPTRIRR